MKKASLFPRSLFWIYFGILLLMSGIHTGIYVLSDVQSWPKILQIIAPVAYWGMVAAGITVFTRKKAQQTYEAPMQLLASATMQVANGDFSIYVPTVHTADHYDYLDYMILDFNRMVEELGSIETLKTDFFSNVSHEMKTPLAVISSNAELLAGKALSDEKRSECEAAILLASKRMNSLITNMLKLNKLEKQAIRPAMERFDVCQQLAECIFQYEEILDERELEISCNLEERAFVYADQELMHLVWTNILSNAVKFTPAKGTITISEGTAGNLVTVSVSDSGCGMTEETIAHIFDKFYQGDTSHAAAGNGLGLALVKRIVDLMDGTVAVISQPGQGSTFTVTLPAGDASQKMENCQ